MVKAIIFDLGGVLVDNPADGMAVHYSKNLNITKEQFLTAFSTYETPWLKGEFSENEFWRKITSDLGVSKPQVESLWLDGLLTIYREKEDVFSLIGTLKKKGYKIAILSNTEIPVMNHIKALHWPHFDLFVYSCEVGMRKPDKEIYELTLEKLKIKPQEAIFIDDKEENIKAAKNLGIYGVLFKDITQVTGELDILLV